MGNRQVTESGWRKPRGNPLDKIHFGHRPKILRRKDGSHPNRAGKLQISRYFFIRWKLNFEIIFLDALFCCVYYIRTKLDFGKWKCDFGTPEIRAQFTFCWFITEFQYFSFSDTHILLYLLRNLLIVTGICALGSNLLARNIWAWYNFCF